MKKIVASFLTFIAILLCIFLGVKYAFSLYSTVEKGEVKIAEGTSAKQVASILQEYGIIHHGDVFYYWIRLHQTLDEALNKEPMVIDFKAGEYTIEKGDFYTVIDQLNEGPDITQASHVFTIPESSTIEQMATILEEKKVLRKEEFLAYAKNPQVYQKLQETYTWLPAMDARKKYLLEGFLQANTYHLPETPTPETVVAMMLKETDGWYQRNREAIDQSGYRFEQLITMASIVERESQLKEDRPKVAQIIYNRLKLNMKLEMDSTVAYAMGKHQVYTYLEDLKTDSPYNTYMYEGLPIGPIGAPSKEAFVGVLQPEGASFDNLYFYSRPNGETMYAKLFSDHEKNRKQYEHEWVQLLQEKK